jgi:hypothetical protein
MTRPELEPFFYRAPAELSDRIGRTLREGDRARAAVVRPATRLFYVGVGLAWAASLLVVSRMSLLESRDSPL